MIPEEIKAKIQEELKTFLKKGFDKIQPKVIEMTSIIMDAYQEGFNTCFELLTGQKFLDNKQQGKTVFEATKEENVDNQNCMKTTNKVEPKFKVGDWVVTSYGKVNQVIAVDDDGDGFTLDDDTYFSGSWKDGYHLWTIADAKDGDILAWDDSKYIALFKNIYDEDSFNSYGFVGHCTGTFESRLSYHDIEAAHPATKEQRDTLFTKMKDAGYEWDNVKRELKKIEQKPIDKVEPKFREGEWVVQGDNILKIKCVGDMNYCFETVSGYVDDMLVSEIDSQFHLWTIDDAKDGDVLFLDLMDGKTFIYNGVNSDMAILYSFIISNDGKDVLLYHIGKPNTGIGYIEEIKNFIYPATKEQRDLLFQKMKETGYEWDDEKKKLKKIEPHNSDEVEAKFQVGDWIVNKFGDSWHIDSFDKKNYQVSDGKGNYNWFPISKQDEMHYWTIKDAKDGDALVTYDIRDNIEWLFLYKPNKHKLHINDPRFYCHYDIKTDSFKKDTDYVSLALGTKFRPTTKEQRDTLFSKMKEEGFEWDTEKKTLSKCVINEGKSEIDYYFTKMMNGEKVIEDLKK